MPTQIVNTGARTYTVAMEEAVPPARRLWAVVQARVLDELTGAPPLGSVRIHTSKQGFSPRVASGGLVGLLAVPDIVFPQLDVQSYDVPFSISADGFVPRHEEAVLPADPQYPDVFVPFVLPDDVALRREPVAISGRVLRRSSGVLAPVAGASVEVTGVWQVLVPAASEPPSDAAALVSLEPPMYAHRTVATGQLQRREVTPVIGEDKTLTAWCAAGDDRIELSDWINLSSGNLLLIDSDPAVQEFGEIDTIDPIGAPDLPATVTLTHRLAFSHRPSRPVRRVTPQVPGPVRSFSRDALAGDTCVFLDSLTSLGGVEVVEIQGGGAPPEYHRVHLFNDVSDSDGRYRLPLLGRVAKLELEANEGATSSGTVEFIPDYQRRENQFDIELS